MNTTITHDTRTAHADDGDDRLERLKGFNTDRMAAALTFLAGYDPGTFDTVIEAAEDLDTDIEPDPNADPIPYCSLCSASVGIFRQSVLEWQHYRGVGLTRPIEVFQADHKPVVVWKPADDLTQWL